MSLRLKPGILFIGEVPDGEAPDILLRPRSARSSNTLKKSINIEQSSYISWMKAEL